MLGFTESSKTRAKTVNAQASALIARGFTTFQRNSVGNMPQHTSEIKWYTDLIIDIRLAYAYRTDSFRKVASGMANKMTLAHSGFAYDHHWLRALGDCRHYGTPGVCVGGIVIKRNLP
jgi:hypothetical protein